MSTPAQIEAAASDTQACEHCQGEFPIEDCLSMVDHWICKGCYEKWKSYFDKCQHKWEPNHDEHGDPGQYCIRCAGFVTDEDFPLMFSKQPIAPPPAAQGSQE